MTVRVVTYQAEYAPAFAELNYQWIKQYFAVEDTDRKALDHPETYALGGEIFFVLKDDEPVGTVAMVPYGDAGGIEHARVYELAKMAVRPDQQGLGFSRLLMDACIEFARQRGAREIMLQTNDVLAPALGLYQRYGFKAVERVSDDRYQRANLEMWLSLTDD